MLIGDHVRLAKTSVGPMDNNAYLLTHDNDALLIDAAAEPDVLLRQLDCLDPVGVVTTHRHHDHIGALATVVEYAKATPAATLLISGYHDKTGDVVINQELAKKRAFAVRDQLVGAGIAADRVILAKPIEMVGGDNNALARRVEISIQ